MVAHARCALTLTVPVLVMLLLAVGGVHGLPRGSDYGNVKGAAGSSNFIGKSAQGEKKQEKTLSFCFLLPPPHPYARAFNFTRREGWDNTSLSLLVETGVQCHLQMFSAPICAKCALAAFGFNLHRFTKGETGGREGCK